MLIDWSSEFDAYLTRLEESDQADDQRRLDLLYAELEVLADLDGVPTDDTATLKRVRQSRRYQVWRVAHPFEAGFAVRLIVWFPSDREVVVALFSADKANMGDVFYDSVGTRADAAIDSWKMQTDRERPGDE
ncbi:hypothetical protein ACNUDN_29250 [Mycobacterium sp. smrl_JER01]|uniref:hypothetical protein n=1 Tax=unclassified Mycobacterium TaxID=2642494 RepID=UPI0002F8ECA4|nr:hypothetical protein [Mycobacterium sp. shizuoka-1]GAY17042.1 hypothetical protein MSZK_37680 [Mycobacterium sp. shizuoka-1]